MRLSELLPQPVRNIYQNCQLLKDPAITAENRAGAIQKISKDCFRLLLILPLAAYSTILSQAFEKANSPFWARMLFKIPCIAISPAANMLYLAVGGACLSVASLIQAIATKSLGFAGLSIVSGLAAALCSEKYETTTFDAINLEDRLITPLSNQMARVFI